MRKLSICVLFGGMSPEYEVSLRSAQTILGLLSPEKYNVFPVGITRDGDWILYTGSDYSLLPTGQWQSYPENRRAAISPVRGQGLLSFEGDCVVRERIDVVFPVLHGKNGEDGAIQGLLELAGIPYVGPRIAASAVSMDKTLTKMVAASIGMETAQWRQVRAADLESRPEQILDGLERAFPYPMFVKPACSGSSVGVSRATDRETLHSGLLAACAYDEKILVEASVSGREVEVAVMGNENPMASICGEIDSGAEFYDYDAKYITDTSVAYVPARLDDMVAEQVRDAAVRIYSAVGCRGLSRVDFFVTWEENRVVLNEINTLPGFTSISMYPKLFEASGIPCAQLVDELIQLALEELP